MLNPTLLQLVALKLFRPVSDVDLTTPALVDEPTALVIFGDSDDELGTFLFDKEDDEGDVLNDDDDDTEEEEDG